jgi:hypothetical protein
MLLLLERMGRAGERALALNAVYDSGDGYPASDLWCGLAGSNFTRPDPTSIGTKVQWLAIVSKAKALGIKLVTWINPSYIWTGSPIFKQAEIDMKQHGLQHLPRSSPAHFFRWSTTQTPTHSKPADSAPQMSTTWAWVWDEDAGASYLSTWGDQPCTDLASPRWREEIRGILTFWIKEMQVDGFVFDYPDGYIGGGVDTHGLWTANAALLKSALTDVVRAASSGSVAAFAELYGAPERAADYGLDGSLADATDGARPAAVARAIATGDARGLGALAFDGTGGPDAVNSQCYSSPWCAVGWQRQIVSPSWLVGDTALDVNSFNCHHGAGASWAPPRNGNFTLHGCFSACTRDARCDAVTVDWRIGGRAMTGEPLVGCYLRGGIEPGLCDTSSAQYSTFSRSAPKHTELLYSLCAAAGVLPAVEYDAAHSWWSDAAWPGFGDAPLNAVLGAMNQASSLGALSLRVDVPTSKKAHYAFARYDAKVTGKLSLAVANFEAHAETVSLNLSALPSAVLGMRPADLVSGTELAPLTAQYALKVPGHSIRLVGELALDAWYQHDRTNCSKGHGASYVPSSSGNMSIAACMLTCLADSRCDAVTMQWRNATFVDCFKRGGIRLAKCEVHAGGVSTYVRAAQAAVDGTRIYV